MATNPRMSSISGRTLLAACISAAASLTVANIARAQNPIVGYETSNSSDYDPWNNNVNVYRNRTITKASALDPYRDRVDPGSLRKVDRYVRDSYGRWVREFGYTWRSFGRPHSTLSRQRVEYSGGDYGDGDASAFEPSYAATGGGMPTTYSYPSTVVSGYNGGSGTGTTVTSTTTLDRMYTVPQPYGAAVGPGNGMAASPAPYSGGIARPSSKTWTTTTQQSMFPR